MAIGSSSNNREGNRALQVIEATLLSAADRLRDNPDRQKQIKILGLNLGIAAADIITLKLGLIGGGALASAFGVTIIFLSVVGVIYGNYRLFAEPAESIQMPPEKLVQTPEDYIEALNRHFEIEIFKEDINQAINQVARLQKKNKTTRELLEQEFSPSRITLEKYLSGVAILNNAFYRNIQMIIIRLDSFDIELADKKDDKHDSGEIGQENNSNKIRKEVLNKYVTSIKSAIEFNEQILLMLDEMLFEISNVDCPDSVKWDQMVKDFKELIDQFGDIYRK